MTRVLIVDDDPVQLRLTSEVASRAGFTPVAAQGGDEALSLMRQSPGFGAVILDLVMPDRDGMAVMEAMTRDGITAPVIIQTAHSSLETVVSAMRQGAAHKPWLVPAIGLCAAPCRVAGRPAAQAARRTASVRPPLLRCSV